MIGAIDYYIVPTECPLEEVEVVELVKQKVVQPKGGSGSSSRRRNLRRWKKERRDLSGTCKSSDSQCNLRANPCVAEAP